MKNIPFVDLKRQYSSIKQEVDNAIQSVVSESTFIKGKHVAMFEENFARYNGARHCIGVGNGTDALTIVCVCLGIGVGDEVIVPANTFIATAEAVSFVGAKPVFVDCDSETYTIDVSKIESAITRRTKAIIPVHLYGEPAEMDSVLSLARKYNLFVIEDAAQAHGAEYRGKKAGTMGDAGCFSFYPSKNLGAFGDAGAIITNNDALAEKVRMFADHGRRNKYEHEFPGVNSRLDAIQAAVLDVKLKHLDRWNENRRKIAALYDKELRGVVHTPKTFPHLSHVYHLYVIQTENRDRVQKTLKENGIESGIHYPTPVPFTKAYGHPTRNMHDFPVSWRLKDRILSLPIHGSMQTSEAEQAVDALKKMV